MQYIIPNNGVNVDYLAHALESMNLAKYHSGATIPHIYFKDYCKELLPEHSKAEQEHIAATLSKIDSLITARREQLAKLDELVKSRFVELFEDGESPIKSVEELCSAIVDCPHTTPKYEGELKNPAIRTAEIKKGYIEWETMRYVSDEEYEERTARLKPEAGDIVYGREGTFGNAAILPKGHNFCLGQRVMLLRPDYSKCTSEYLLYAVISDDVYRQALEKNNASTVAHVNVKDVKLFRIPLPSFDKQNQFATFVEQVDKSKLAIQQSLEKLETLKKSLMQKYFN
jgi:type I restriction enzyme S subunit